MRIAMIQMKVSSDPEKNFQRACSLIEQISGTDIIVLPEAFIYPFGIEVDKKVDSYLEEFKRLAKKKNSIIVCGSLPEPTEEGIYNTCYVINNDGDLLGKYRKIHMYDVDLPGLKSKESDSYKDGNEPFVFDSPFGKIGIAICFDLRFPELFINMANKGATTIIVPAAFSTKTGPDHWVLLNRARALDSQAFIAACAPAYNNTSDFPVYGHSCVVDPNGKLRADVDGAEQIIFCDYDPKEAEVMRKTLPVLPARKPKAYLK